jgi:hypothetical protein
MNRLTLAACGLLSLQSALAVEPRDPTRPPQVASHAAAPREAPPVLSAIMSFNGERSAIFNGQLVHSGALVGSYTIEAILEDGVRVRHEGLVQELHLPRLVSTFKKPAAPSGHGAGGVQ